MMTGGLEFEIVPNVSEGREGRVVDACAAAMERAGARVIHRTSDPHHHRSVITAVGDRAEVLAAAVALAREARERIDLRAHRGAHPRIGALDVLPFVPLGTATLDDAVLLARSAAARIWDELRVPSYLYGAASTASHRTHLADIRRGEFEGLAARLVADEGWRFDYGDAAHATAGAIAIGARPFLIAFNVELASSDLALARRIARTLRASSGGLRTLRSLGLRLDHGRV
ncbi:MAG: glutamate formiminotransferase, partial [Candidatus Eremiobacteraeota bacterium]|nr:glutamate formiminotransferase [Candidatus Eremiobacteraeota bacterium]